MRMTTPTTHSKSTVLVFPLRRAVAACMLTALAVGMSNNNGVAAPAAGWEIDYAQPLRGGPITLGFDTFFGISASNNMPPYCFIKDDCVAGNPAESHNVLDQHPAIARRLADVLTSIRNREARR